MRPLKRKNNIEVYGDGKQLMGRRQEMLDMITKNQPFLPDSVLHDDLDMGMLEFVKENFRIVSDGEEIPIISKILTVQRWNEIANNWEFSDEDRNMKIPFIGIIRKPDVQPGTNPANQRTIPNRKTFHYMKVPTWNGSEMGADIYKIPQPVYIDISFEIVIVCHKFRDLNRFNKIIMQKFSSRQAYTIVKGHYIPILLERITDNSPIDTLEARRFYSQSYDFTMLGFLMDSEEFEVKPAISRVLLLNEFVETNRVVKKYYNKSIETKTAIFIADGYQTVFSVGETIGFLFFVAINGLIQEKDINYYFIGQTSKVTFVEPPIAGSEIMISYYAGKDSVFTDSYGKLLFLETENFVYDGSTLIFTLQNKIDSIIHVEINGLVDEEGDGFAVTADSDVQLLYTPVIGSRIGICYVH